MSANLRRPVSWAVLLGAAGTVGGTVAVSAWESPLSSVAAMVEGGRYLGPGDGVRQVRANDCGPAALAECLRRLGRAVPYPDPESGVRLGPRGCGFADLVAEAERYGLRAVHRKVGRGDVLQVTPPAVLYLRRGHFVVLERTDARGGVILHDPAVGRIGLPAGALERIWTGDVLTFGPDGAGP